MNSYLDPSLDYNCRNASHSGRMAYFRVRYIAKQNSPYFMYKYQMSGINEMQKKKEIVMTSTMAIARMLISLEDIVRQHFPTHFHTGNLLQNEMNDTIE